ncbi:disulfide bond formation protein B [Rhodospirillum centenum]|uniref:Disulfide bond formation protein, DsbB family, putative n=1 Tax=Rhodospirillum centenum (strain ATCC 51521 / SW) TaxID=414684 RepID=B6IYT5_RHOCS|nr:disulfide bond formation protein B [Rhodospirillum centenum]ACJ01459.1 disulfide bond formation protein, DsbB family, putative [Rhodospirillum centenum SW]
MSDLLSTRPRLIALLLLAGAAGALGAAVTFQYRDGLPPCELCHWQRWAHAAAIGLLLPAPLALTGQRARGMLLALGGTAFLAGAGIALFHVGVEEHWWQGLSACSVSGPAPDSIEALRAQILGAPLVRCDEIQWSLAGLSMAAWNMVLSLGLALLAFATAWAGYRRRNA